MNYLPRSKSKHSYWKKALVLLGIFVALAFFFSLLGGRMVSVLTPVWQGENIASRVVRNTFEYFHTHGSLARENTRQKDRIASLELELSAANLALSEQETFSALLGREKRGGEVIASVLTRPPQSLYDLFLIDAGEKDGVALGAKVSLPEGPLLGTVSEVFPGSAKVRLFSSAGEKEEAVLERGNIPVTMEGQGGGFFRIIVPRETPAEVGDRVVSSDTSYGLVGVVEAIESGPTDSFKVILAKGPANVFSVRLVSVSLAP